MGPEADPKTDWIGHMGRILSVIDNQVRSLRKRQLIEAFQNGTRKGTYWGIRTNLADYGLPSAIACPHEKTLKLAEVATRLKRLDDDTQERLINWGYAVCDAAIRKHVQDGSPPALPYPERGVG